MAKRRSKKKINNKTLPGGWTLKAVSRGLAFFLGTFTLLNVLGDLRSPGFDANHWWIDLRPIQSPAADIFLAIAAILLILYSIRPTLTLGRRMLTLAFVAALLVVTTWNSIFFYVLLAGKSVCSGFSIAFSLFVSIALVLLLFEITLSSTIKKDPVLLSRIIMIGVVGLCFVGFPLAQIYCFGKTDYRRPADVIVVFGARVYADGIPSDALADRVRTGCQLYRNGLAHLLVFSGGPGDGPVHETEAMLAMAMQLGVPREAILLDKEGVNTRATVHNTCHLFSHLGSGTVLAVSHFYHLPRIKMSYQRQGWEVYTVPAKESYQLSAMPKFIAREIAALWVYYLRPLLPVSQ